MDYPPVEELRNISSAKRITVWISIPRMIIIDTIPKPIHKAMRAAQDSIRLGIARSR
jgi:hypothetical protein